MVALVRGSTRLGVSTRSATSICLPAARPGHIPPGRRDRHRGRLHDGRDRRPGDDPATRRAATSSPQRRASSAMLLRAAIVGPTGALGHMKSRAPRSRRSCLHVRRLRRPLLVLMFRPRRSTTGTLYGLLASASSTSSRPVLQEAPARGAVTIALGIAGTVLSAVGIMNPLHRLPWTVLGVAISRPTGGIVVAAEYRGARRMRVASIYDSEAGTPPTIRPRTPGADVPVINLGRGLLRRQSSTDGRHPGPGTPSATASRPLGYRASACLGWVRTCTAPPPWRTTRDAPPRRRRADPRGAVHDHPCFRGRPARGRRALRAELIRFDTSNPTSDERPAPAGSRAGWLRPASRPSSSRARPGSGQRVMPVRGRRSLALVRPAPVHGHLTSSRPTRPSGRCRRSPAISATATPVGRGAIDMKDTVAVMLATARHFARTGTKPSRDLRSRSLADEEAGASSAHPARRAPARPVRGRHRGDRRGRRASYALDDTRRLYPIGERAARHGLMELTANGRAGHGSSPNDENAVTDLAESSPASAATRSPVRLIEPVRALLQEAADLKGVEARLREAEDLTPNWLAGSRRRLHAGGAPQLREPDHVHGRLPDERDPGKATARVDGRFPARPRAGTRRHHRRVAPSSMSPARGSTTTSPWRRRSTARSSTPCATRCAPRTRTATWSRTATRAAPTPRPSPKLGIRCFGFKGLKLPADLDYGRLFHGVDERVPLEGCASRG